MDTFNRAVKIYREEGMLELINKSKNRVLDKIKLNFGKLYTQFIPPLPELVGKKNIDRVEAKFEISTNTEFRRIAYDSEIPVLKCFLQDIRNGDVIYDVGANIGIYSFLADKTNNNNTIVSFEPNPDNITALETNKTINNSNIIIKNVALSNKNGEQDLHIGHKGERGEGQSSIFSDKGGLHTETVSVKTRRGDDFIENDELPSPDLMKIDVEGAESAVLDGFNDTLRDNNCRIIYCEIHHPENKKEDLIEFMVDCGYDVEVLLQRGGTESGTTHIRAISD